MDLIPLVFSSGWASGVNAYLVVLVLGLGDRLGHLDQVPDALGRTDVLVVAGLLYAVEFVTDKIPGVDSAWDAVSTVIRPGIAAALALLVSGDATTLQQAGYAALGGGTALTSHLVKAGARLAVNSSPEPLSNVVASLAEDGLVLGVVLVAVQHPWLAMALCVLLLLGGLALLLVLARVARRGWRRWKGRPLPPRTG